MNPAIEELERKAEQATGIQKINLLNSLAYETLKLESAKAEDYANQARTLSYKFQYSQGEAQAHRLLGIICRNRNDYTEALEHHHRSLEIFESQFDPKGQAQNLNNIGSVYKHLGYFSKAYDYQMRALKIFNEHRLPEGKAHCLNNIGILHKNFGQYEKAKQCYFQSLEIFQQIDNSDGQCNNLNNLGIVSLMMDDYTKALDYFFQSLELRKKIGSDYGVAITMMNIGEAYYHTRQYKESIEFSQKSFEALGRVGDSEAQAGSLSGIAKCKLEMGETEQALNTINKAMATIAKIENNDRMADLHFLAYKAQKKLGQFNKAIEHLELYEELSGQVLQMETEEKMKNLQLIQKENVVKKEVGLQRSRHEAFRNLADQVLMIKRYTETLENEAHSTNSSQRFSSVEEFQKGLEGMQTVIEKTEFKWKTFKQSLSTENQGTATSLKGKPEEAVAKIESLIQATASSASNAEHELALFKLLQQENAFLQQDTDLATLLKFTVEKLATHRNNQLKDTKKKVEVSVRIESGLPSIEMEPADFITVVNNLLDVSFMAMDKSLSENSNFQPLIEVTIQKKSGSIEIVVSDNGSGMAIDGIERKFDRNNVTNHNHAEKSALGLAISRQIVRSKLGGDLKVLRSGQHNVLTTIRIPVLKHSEKTELSI